MPYRRSRFILVVVDLLIGACAGGDARTPVVVRDSAGITIVENPQAQPSVRAWTLGDSPDIAIGTLDTPEEQQLFRVNAAALLPDGRIAVANDGTKEIRFFDSAGRFVGATGRDGEGPGEFRSVYSLLLGADSVLVGDFRLGRVSVLDLNGDFVRSFALPEMGGLAFPTIAGAFGDDTLLVRLMNLVPPSQRGAGLRSDSATFFQVDRQGLVLDTLGMFLRGDMYVHVEGPRIRVSTAPFGRAASVATAKRRFYYGSSDQFEIEVRDPAGALDRLVRLDRSPREVTPEDIERMKRQQLDGIDDEGDAAQMERLLAEIPFPSAMPAFSSLLVDPEGNLWVGSYRATAEEPTRWAVFDRDGRLLAELETPARFTVFQVGADWVLGRRTDELDVERVELYSLRKPAS